MGVASSISHNISHAPFYGFTVFTFQNVMAQSRSESLIGGIDTDYDKTLDGLSSTHLIIWLNCKYVPPCLNSSLPKTQSIEQGYLTTTNLLVKLFLWYRETSFMNLEFLSQFGI